jgi:hypothetical protein
VKPTGPRHRLAWRCIRAVTPPSRSKSATSRSSLGSTPGRNSNITQVRGGPPAGSGTITVRRPSAAGSTLGVLIPSSARSADSQSSSDSIAALEW